MRGRLGLILVLMLGALASPVLAQQEIGDSEIQFQGSLSLTTVSGIPNIGSVTALYGRFLTLHQEVGAKITTYVDDDSNFGGSIGPFYRYNLSSSGKVIPYVGAAATSSFYNSDIGDEPSLDLEAGVRYFLDRKTALSVQGVTSHSEFQDFGDHFAILIGFSHLWGR